MVEHMTKTSWVELCVSDFEQSIIWFEQVLGFRVVAREAIELYRQRAERLIAQRGRQNYQQACTFLAKMSALYEQLGEHDAWTSYLTGLREQNRNLRALKEEMADAGL
jgi:hypothetical protein